MFFRRLIIIFITIGFLSSLIIPPQWALAQGILGLPSPGTMVSLSPSYMPVLIKGLKINKSNPLALDFIVATGNTKLKAQDPQLRKEAQKLIKYFFAALTLPEKDVWVNLSPYEKDRIIPKATGETEMGRDMLAQDYILKQITASLIYPEKGLGKNFWNKIYTESFRRFGTTEVPVNTFNKVWIMADKASVYEANNAVFVVDSHLKVMLEEDYLATLKHQKPSTSSTLASNIVRQVILPALEKEVNEGKNFANLRQIFHSLILAKWYKETLKTALLNQVYSNKSKIAGVGYKNTVIASEAEQSLNLKNTNDLDMIYQQYLKAYKKGVFNYIKDDIDQTTKQPIPRKYFSGGVSAAMTVEHLQPGTHSSLRRLAAVITAGIFFSVFHVAATAQRDKSFPVQIISRIQTRAPYDAAMMIEQEAKINDLEYSTMIILASIEQFRQKFTFEKFLEIASDNAPELLERRNIRWEQVDRDDLALVFGNLRAKGLIKFERGFYYVTEEGRQTFVFRALQKLIVRGENRLSGALQGNLEIINNKERRAIENEVSSLIAPILHNIDDIRAIRKEFLNWYQLQPKGMMPIFLPELKPRIISHVEDFKNIIDDLLLEAGYRDSTTLPPDLIERKRFPLGRPVPFRGGELYVYTLFIKGRGENVIPQGALIQVRRENGDTNWTVMFTKRGGPSVNDILRAKKNELNAAMSSPTLTRRGVDAAMLLRDANVNNPFKPFADPNATTVSYDLKQRKGEDKVLARITIERLFEYKPITKKEFLNAGPNAEAILKQLEDEIETLPSGMVRFKQKAGAAYERPLQMTGENWENVWDEMRVQLPQCGYKITSTRPYLEGNEIKFAADAFDEDKEIKFTDKPEDRIFHVIDEGDDLFREVFSIIMPNDQRKDFEALVKDHWSHAVYLLDQGETREMSDVFIPLEELREIKPNNRDKIDPSLPILDFNRKIGEVVTLRVISGSEDRKPISGKDLKITIGPGGLVINGNFYRKDVKKTISLIDENGEGIRKEHREENAVFIEWTNTGFKLQRAERVEFHRDVYLSYSGIRPVKSPRPKDTVPDNEVGTEARTIPIHKFSFSGKFILRLRTPFGPGKDFELERKGDVLKGQREKFDGGKQAFVKDEGEFVEDEEYPISLQDTEDGEMVEALHISFNRSEGISLTREKATSSISWEIIKQGRPGKDTNTKRRQIVGTTFNPDEGKFSILIKYTDKDGSLYQRYHDFEREGDALERVAGGKIIKGHGSFSISFPSRSSATKKGKLEWNGSEITMIPPEGLEGKIEYSLPAKPERFKGKDDGKRILDLDKDQGGPSFDPFSQPSIKKVAYQLVHSYRGDRGIRHDGTVTIEKIFDGDDLVGYRLTASKNKKEIKFGDPDKTFNVTAKSGEDAYKRGFIITIPGSPIDTAFSAKVQEVAGSYSFYPIADEATEGFEEASTPGEVPPAKNAAMTSVPGAFKIAENLFHNPRVVNVLFPLQKGASNDSGHRKARLKGEIRSFLRRENKAMTSVNTHGGIDLDSSKFNIQKNGSGVDIKFDPAMIARFRQGNFDGIFPVITGVTGNVDIFSLLGLKEPEENEKLAA